MDTNEEGFEHLFDEDNSITVEEQPREADIHVLSKLLQSLMLLLVGLEAWSGRIS